MPSKRFLIHLDRIMIKGINMEKILEEADENRVAKENHLPSEKSKHEKPVLRKQRRKKNAEVKWVKWLGIIMDESETGMEGKK